MATATLIGRRTELELLEDVLAAARDGRSRVLVLRGAAGIGKTALLEAAAAPDFRVLRAEGVEAESELAFAGLHQLLWPLAPLVERLVPPQRAALEAMFGVGDVRDRFAVAAGALSLLAEAAEEQPLLCLVDDLQWLDRPSAEAIGFVGRRLHAERIALLIAVRDSSPVPPVLARFAPVDVAPLDRGEARALLERAGRLGPAERERVLDLAAGNPLALLELPRGTGSVARAFAQRLEALPPPTLRALLLAAADDDPAGTTALRAIDVADLAPAEAAGLVRVDGDRVAFRHPLVRSAAYDRAPFAERREAHEALGAALTEPGDADRRAWHRAAAAAGPDADVAAELVRSSERARARGGHAAAGAALERAARLTAPETLRAQRLVAAADAARQAGDYPHAAALAAEVVSLDADAGSTAQAIAIRGATRARQGDFEAGERDLREAARALAETRPQPALLIAMRAAETAALAGHHDRAVANARWAAGLPVGDSAGDRAMVAYARGMAWVFAGDWAGARAAFADAFGLAERTTDPQLLTWTAIGALYTGDVATSRRGMERALEIARGHGAMGDVAFGQPIMAYLHLVAGRFAIARTDAAEGLALALATGEDGAAAHCRALLAWVAAVRGDEGEPPAAPHVLAVEATQRALALRDLADGRHDAALDRLASLFDAPGAHPARRLFAVGDLVEAAIGAARPEAAEAPLGALRAWANATGSPWGAAIVAGAELQLGDETAYERALAAHERIALPFDRGRLELKLGERLRRAKQRTEARRHLRAAIEAFARTGAEPWERRAAAELRATGETARTRDPSTLDDLTPQELQIARMVAEGATNRDVAGRLFLSPRTVDYHLRKVFQKLSVNSRTQLAGLDW